MEVGLLRDAHLVGPTARHGSRTDRQLEILVVELRRLWDERRYGLYLAASLSVIVNRWQKTSEGGRHFIFFVVAPTAWDSTRII